MFDLDRKFTLGSSQLWNPRVYDKFSHFIRNRDAFRNFSGNPAHNGSLLVQV